MKGRTHLLAILLTLLFAASCNSGDTPQNTGPIETEALAAEPPREQSAEPAATPQREHPASKRLFFPETRHDYQRIDVSMSWHDAKKYCESLGGHLATVSSAAENAFIYNSFGRDHVCWLGATDEIEEGKWHWVTGELFTFQNWARGEPGNSGKVEHHLVLGTTRSVVDKGRSYFYRFGLSWNDHAAHGRYHGVPIAYPVCEWEEHDENAVTASAASIDRYAVPAGGVEELLTFIENLRKYRPPTEREAAEHRHRAQAPLTTAAKRILTVEKDEWSKAFQTALLVLLDDRVRMMERASPVQQQQTLAQVKTFLTAKAEKGLQPQDVDLARAAAAAVESAGNLDLAGQAYGDFAKLVAQSKDDKVSSMAEVFEGVVRRLGLVGQDMKLDGTKMDGSKFDWSAYRGKVVLVYFWSADSDPCRAELPSVKLNHQLYHGRDFEVVGISTDSNRKELDEFLDKEQLPWAVLHEKDPSTPHPLATHYGITKVPTAMLVDKDGKVVTVQARGADLDKLLEKLIGPPYAPEGRLTYIDLQPKANQKLAESFERPDRPNNLAELPRGEQTFGGVRFNIGDSLVHLGQKRRPVFPAKVEGIPVNQKLTKLYILHGTQWGLGSDGTKIAEYRVHYEDGTQQTIPIVLGEDVRDWWNNDGSKAVTRGKVVWAGQNAASRINNKHLRLYLTAWNSPHPDKKVVRIDFVSPDTSDAGPFCVAMTIEEAAGPETDQ